MRPDEPDPAPDAEPAPGDSLRRGYARGRERDERIRASLEPLAPNESPGAVKVAAAVAALLGGANVILLAADVEIDGKEASPAAVAAFAAVMLALAFGMWRGSYWTVLAFQALLGVTIVIAALSLMVASNATALLLCTAIVLLGGSLFWKLIRAMARMQMPGRQLDL